MANHKDFANYSQYDRLDSIHVQIKELSDEYGIDWILEDDVHILFSFKYKNEIKSGIHLDKSGLLELKAWVENG